MVATHVLFIIVKGAWAFVDDKSVSDKYMYSHCEWLLGKIEQTRTWNADDWMACICLSNLIAIGIFAWAFLAWPISIPIHSTYYLLKSARFARRTTKCLNKHTHTEEGTCTYK